MLILDTTTIKLQAVLSGAVATTELDIAVGYGDQTASAYTKGRKLTPTNGTTPVDVMLAPAASATRNGEFVSVKNRDTAAATITFQFNDNGTVYKLWTATLDPGETFGFTHSAGPYCNDVNGNRKNGSVQDLSAYLTIVAAVAAYQPLDSDLTAIAALSTTAYGRAFLALADAAAARTALSLGTAATAATGDFDAAGAAAAAQAASQPLDSDLTALAGLNIAADKLPYGNGSHTMALADFTAAGRALVDDADAAAQRTTLGLGTAATTNATAYATAAQGSTADSAAQLAFKTIAVSGQSNVVADSATDTLTFVAGSGMTITTDASTDTVTLAASGGASPGGSGTEPQYRVDATTLGGMAGVAWDDTNRSEVRTGATVTTSKPVQSFTQTWNDGAVTFTGWKLNITSTASAGDSQLVEMQLAGTPKFKVRKDGQGYFAGNVQTDGWFEFGTGTSKLISPIGAGFGFYVSGYLAALGAFGFRTNSTGVWGWTPTDNNVASDTSDTGLERVSAGLVGINNGSAGTFRDLKLRNLIADNVIQRKSFTVATLPSAASWQGGDVFVTDASTTLVLGLGTTVAGSGSNKVPAYSDSANWLYG